MIIEVFLGPPRVIDCRLNRKYSEFIFQTAVVVWGLKPISFCGVIAISVILFTIELLC